MLSGKLSLIFLSCYLSCFVPVKLQEPCENYREIDDWRRSVSNNEVSSLCDSFLSAGWYRITSGAGEEMPTQCIEGGFRCGTVSTIWMNSSYPPAGLMYNVTACVSSYSGDCCQDSYEIQVKNCSGYYVYNLLPTKACPQRYCFGYELPCPVGETSKTGFTPGCTYEPCLEVNHEEINDWKRSVNNKETGSLCDSFLHPGWYRATSKAGEIMPTSCIPNGFACGTVNPIWMNVSSFPSDGETRNATACSSNYKGDCCSNKYEIQVRNCSEFLVYNLQPTVHCPESYCFGTELPCKEGETSDNGFTPCEFEPCLEVNHKEINNWKRSVNNKETGSLCDSFLQPGWYRSTSKAGEIMPTSCIHNGFACGTVNPIWMNASSFPSDGETKNATACSASYLGDCCSNKYEIQVRNCSEFLVYNLQPTVHCPESYCYGSEVPCTEGETSDNGFTPCEFDPCHSTNYQVIKGQIKRSSSYTLLADDDPIDDSNLTQAFYRFDSETGNDIANSEQEMYRCGTMFPMYMKGSLPVPGDKTVSRKVCLSGIHGKCQNETELKVRNCGNFRVYELKPAPLQLSGYCVGTLPVPLPDSTTVKTKLVDDDDIPWIVTVACLGAVCTGLISAFVFKKLAVNGKIQETPPPPYSPPEISKPPVNYLVNNTIPPKECFKIENT